MAPAKTKILIVESFQANIELITQELEKGLSHYNFEVATTKKEFKKMLRTYKPDLILSNNIFTSFDGMSIFLIKKKLAPHIPFIFVSYPAREEHIVEFFANGLTDFILKDNLCRLPIIIKRALQDNEIHKINEDYNNKELSPIQVL